MYTVVDCKGYAHEASDKEELLCEIISAIEIWVDKGTCVTNADDELTMTEKVDCLLGYSIRTGDFGDMLKISVLSNSTGLLFD